MIKDVKKGSAKFYHLTAKTKFMKYRHWSFKVNSKIWKNEFYFLFLFVSLGQTTPFLKIKTKYTTPKSQKLRQKKLMSEKL